MSPLPPMGRARAMKAVADGKIPFDFGSPHPKVAIVQQDGVFRIRALVINPADAEGVPTPEAYYALGKPVGEIFVEAPTTDALLAAMETMEWPADW